MHRLRNLGLINILAIAALAALAALAGCLHIAKTEDLPASANDLRFDEITKKAAPPGRRLEPADRL